MKQESLCTGRPVTRYYLNDNGPSGTNFVVVSVFNPERNTQELLLEFLVFSWTDPTDITYPHTERMVTDKERINSLFESKLTGSIQEYVAQTKSVRNSPTANSPTSLQFVEVERNVMNAIAFPFGVKLLEIIILSTDSTHLKNELRTLRDFILLVHRTQAWN